MPPKFTEEQIAQAFEDIKNSEFMRLRRHDLEHGTRLSHAYIEQHGARVDVRHVAKMRDDGTTAIVPEVIGLAAANEA